MSNMQAIVAGTKISAEALGMEKDIGTLEKGKLADLIAVNLNFVLDGLPLYFALVVIFVSTVILTQFISNAASVALILPVAIQFSNVLGISPTALIMLVLFGASQSFLTPMGYQTNLMVYGPGRYRFFDIAKYGAGLTLSLIHISEPTRRYAIGEARVGF